MNAALGGPGDIREVFPREVALEVSFGGGIRIFQQPWDKEGSGERGYMGSLGRTHALPGVSPAQESVMALSRQQQCEG